MPNDNKIQELQITEQNLQNLLMQKQAFQMESAETASALGEIESAGDEVFKIVGQLMVKSDKSKIKSELENKQKLLELRINSIEKQENSLSEKLETLRKEIMKKDKK